MVFFFKRIVPPWLFSRELCYTIHRDYLSMPIRIRFIKKINSCYNPSFSQRKCYWFISTVESIFIRLVKTQFFARTTSEKARCKCILTRNSSKKNLNVEYAHQVFKILTNYGTIEWLHTKHICLLTDVKKGVNSQSHQIRDYTGQRPWNLRFCTCRLGILHNIVNSLH